MYDSGYQSTYSTNGDMNGFFVFLGIFTLLLLLVVYVVNSIFLAKVFKKAGEEGWKAWVPVYNLWVLLELGEQPGWVSLLLLPAFIPFIGALIALVPAVYSAIAAYKIGLKFGKEDAFVLLYIFLPLVWVIWLAVDSKAVWKGSTNPAVSKKDDQAPAQTPSM
jgi:hypothetical protein